MTDLPPRAAARAPAEDELHGPGFFRSIGYAVREIVVIAVMAMVLSLVVKTWVAQAFYIPSGSMERTLQLDDRVMVSKLHKRFDGVNHGDIVVFKDPGGWLPPGEQLEARDGWLGTVERSLTFVGLLPDPADEHLIKRVIGVAGDRVVCCDDENRLTVNGAPLEEPYIYPGDASSVLKFDITVPADAVWVMGDHRSDSQDSRYHPLQGDGTEGSVPLERVVGRAVLTVWPFTRVTTLSNHAEVFSAVPAP